MHQYMSNAMLTNPSDAVGVEQCPTVLSPLRRMQPLPHSPLTSLLSLRIPLPLLRCFTCASIRAYAVFLLRPSLPVRLCCDCLCCLRFLCPRCSGGRNRKWIRCTHRHNTAMQWRRRRRRGRHCSSHTSTVRRSEGMDGARCQRQTAEEQTPDDTPSVVRRWRLAGR